MLNISVTTFVIVSASSSSIFFFFNDTATTEIYTLSLHDALPICLQSQSRVPTIQILECVLVDPQHDVLQWLKRGIFRSEEHTSELQSLTNLVCRLLLEKKKK